MNDDVFEDNWVRNALTGNMQTIGMHRPFIVDVALFGMTTFHSELTPESLPTVLRKFMLNGTETNSVVLDLCKLQ